MEAEKFAVFQHGDYLWLYVNFERPQRHKIIVGYPSCGLQSLLKDR
jgi:hypothetical protein